MRQCGELRNLGPGLKVYKVGFKCRLPGAEPRDQVVVMFVPEDQNKHIVRCNLNSFHRIEKEMSVQRANEAANIV